MFTLHHRPITWIDIISIICLVRSPFGTHCQSGEAEANTTSDAGDSKEKLESEQVALASDKVTEEKEDSLTSYVGKKIGLVTYVMG